MELREMNRTFDTEETTELLSPSHRDNMEIESYFIGYAIQKEIINRNRCPASRRLLSQTAHLADFNLTNGNQKVVYHVSFSLFAIFYITNYIYIYIYYPKFCIYIYIYYI